MDGSPELRPRSRGRGIGDSAVVGADCGGGAGVGSAAHALAQSAGVDARGRAGSGIYNSNMPSRILVE